jgi:ribosome-binding protein aMBF1 (putative translation factor)
MITGTQIREARELVGWSRYMLAHKAPVPFKALCRAEDADGRLPTSSGQANAIRLVLEAAGVEFINEQPGVRLRMGGAT